MNYEVNDFQMDVIDASREKPVLVDFWAPWCGPCRMIGPVLEKLAREQADRWTLVKVNTDVHPEVSGAYDIRGIPAVKLFSEGKVVDEFTGALPEYAIVQWLDKALPSENKRRIERARMALAGGNTDEATDLLNDVLATEPNHPEARLLLAQQIVFDEPEQAERLLGEAAFAGAGYMQAEESIKTVVRLHRLHENPESLPDEPVKEIYLKGIEAVMRKDFETAAPLFIEVIRKDRYYDDDGARKACLALFALLGDDHPAVAKNRRLFDMALY